MRLTVVHSWVLSLMQGWRKDGIKHSHHGSEFRGLSQNWRLKIPTWQGSCSLWVIGLPSKREFAQTGLTLWQKVGEVLVSLYHRKYDSGYVRPVGCWRLVGPLRLSCKTGHSFDQSRWLEYHTMQLQSGCLGRQWNPNKARASNLHDDSCWW